MDWAVIIAKAAPIAVSMLETAIQSFYAPAKPAAPVAPDSAPKGTVASPDEFIRSLQVFLNLAVKPEPPLKEDGWLGPATRAAGLKGIMMFKARGIGN
jgi:hypothetical protein